MTEEEQNIGYWLEIMKGKQKTLFDLYNNTYFHLVRFGLKLVANDELVKDCIIQLFLKIWDKRANLNVVQNVRSYLFTSLRNMLVDQLEQLSRMSDAISGLTKQTELTELSYEEIIIRSQNDEEMKQKVRHAMDRLTPRQLEAIKLKFFEGLSYEEVARRTTQTVKTAYNNIYEAIKILRKALAE
ncbi:MAG TPA: sigma-70 family RNA polymerase sigma factor [Flavitalea sp.]|nr:sigma-70 family RNA polymerase sigma factor [Flavitalea sp.]